MAKFYVCIDDTGAVFDCTQVYGEAVQIVRGAGGGSVVAMDVAVTAANMAKVLGKVGGYASSVKTIYIK
jgi:hypothetical protein